MKRRDFVKTTTTAILGGAYTFMKSPILHKPVDPNLLSNIDPGSFDGSWWNREPVRLIQTNLREIDAQMDVEAYVQSMIDCSVNLVLLNVGGIVANYPTQLEFHYRNPFMEGDLVGELIERLHANDIRVMGRFDFSKVNEEIATQKPEWLFVSEEGQNVNYNGQVHACPSRGYQQEYAFQILEEAITSYPLDAIFFNMPGYQTNDYSGNNYGQCQCEDCLRLFSNGSGITRSDVSSELFSRMHSYIKELDPDIVIATYTTVGVDMVSTESSSWLTSAHEWNYSATDHVKRTLNSYTDLTPKNLLIGFLAIGFRHIATSPNIAKVWQLQNMLHGGSLNYVFIGPIEDYQDRAYVPILKDMYRFHKTHDKLFTNVQSAAKVALIRGNNQEYRGLIKLLSEEHIIFDIIAPDVIGSSRMPRPLEDYDTVVLGDIRNMGEELISSIDQYVQNGGKLLTTGFSSVSTPDNSGFGGGGRVAYESPESHIQLQCLGVMPSYEFFPQSHSTYLNINDSDRAAFGDEELRDFSLMMMYGDFMKLRTRNSARGFMNLIPHTMYGPPEKNYFLEDEITDYPGIVYNEYGEGKSIFIPWGLGAQYNFKGHHIHRALFASIMNNVLQAKNTLETNAPHLLEMSHLVNLNGAFEWVGLINHTGQIGPTLGKSIPIYNTSLRLQTSKPIQEIILMKANQSIDFQNIREELVEFIIPEVNDFELALCLYK